MILLNFTQAQLLQERTEWIHTYKIVYLRQHQKTMLARMEDQIMPIKLIVIGPEKQPTKKSITEIQVNDKA